MSVEMTSLFQILRRNLSADDTHMLLSRVKIPAILRQEADSSASRALIAEALNLLLLHDLLGRSAVTRAYFGDLQRQDAIFEFDHGALRSIDLADMGSLPAGETAITRILCPLGYAMAELYPLDRLAMTGRSYRHQDFPADIPQFFVSELHVDRFSPAFQQAAQRVTASSVDPLDKASLSALNILAATHKLAVDQAADLVGILVHCFTRRHAAPAMDDYEILLAESAEMAWISTEGNAFNHATDRVSDMETVVQAQRDAGRAVKKAIEISRSGRVRQTAFLADPVTRDFVSNGQIVQRVVPGSFFEFIERDPLPDGSGLDLSFDTGNAQGIFKMTAAGAPANAAP